MKKSGMLLLAALSAWLLCGCSIVVPKPPPQNTVTQVSTIDALLSGVYDGSVTLRQLGVFGNTGIGTFDALDGEMVMFDGRIYQVKADGKVYRPALEEKTPFAAVVDFKADRVVVVNQPCSFKDFEKLIDAEFPDMNMMSAIVVKGSFDYVKTRSVPRQSRPYPPLTEVVKNQPEFELRNLDGYIVGFRLPAYVKGINVPGYHLHFICSEFISGGHILDFSMRKGSVGVDICDRFYMILPDAKTGFSDADLSKDRSQELMKAER
ncbi:MAG: acetolactate decarboxylase [Victivallales bacterium]|nr:acetolactate decarboxylase [Victivallales bacterium]